MKNIFVFLFILSTQSFATGVVDSSTGKPLIWVNSLKGAVSVHVADVHTEFVDEHLIQLEGTTDTLNAAASVGDSVITVVNGAQFLANDRIILSENEARETSTIKIISVATNVITIDKPLSHNYTTAAIVSTVIKSINVSGTIAVPQVFTVSPPAGEVWIIEHMTISMVHTSAASDDLFGDLAKLVNGVVFRQESSIIRNLTVWRDNGDIIEDVGVDIRYSAKSGGGLFGTSARWSFDGSGVSLKLDGDNGDVFKAIIQDDLTGLSDVEIKIQGHIEGI